MRPVNPSILLICELDAGLFGPERLRLRRIMSLLNNAATIATIRSIFALTSSCHRLGVERVPRDKKGLLLACTHLSHYDPLCVSVLLRRKVDWMARAEFFRSPVASWFVTQASGFEIDRFGFALPGIREALRRLEQDRCVGVFPEGEVSRGKTSVLHGGPLKQGVALVARRAAVPVVPCVMLNAQQFSRVVPWLPLRSGRLYVGFGEPLRADENLPPGRASRAELTQRIDCALVALYQELCERFDVPEKLRPHPDEVWPPAEATP